MALRTKGFESLVQLRRHFSEHGSDFSASNPNEYEEMADEFLGGDMAGTMYECVRPGGAKLRYDSSTDAFGVLDPTDIIRTFFKPVPCSSLAGAMREQMRRSGRCHSSANNLVYIKTECKK